MSPKAMAVALQKNAKRVGRRLMGALRPHLAAHAQGMRAMDSAQEEEAFRFAFARVTLKSVKPANAQAQLLIDPG